MITRKEKQNSDNFLFEFEGHTQVVNISVYLDKGVFHFTVAIFTGIQLIALKKPLFNIQRGVLSIAVEFFSAIFRYVFYVEVGNQFHSKTPLDWLVRETYRRIGAPEPS